MTPLPPGIDPPVRQKEGGLQKVFSVGEIQPSLSGNHSFPRSPAHRILPHPDWKLVTKLSGSLEREMCGFCKVWIPSEKESLDISLIQGAMVGFQERESMGRSQPFSLEMGKAEAAATIG